MTGMAELIDLTLTLGSDRISLVPGLIGVETEPIQTQVSLPPFLSELTVSRVALGTVQW